MTSRYASNGGCGSDGSYVSNASNFSNGSYVSYVSQGYFSPHRHGMFGNTPIFSAEVLGIFTVYLLQRCVAVQLE